MINNIAVKGFKSFKDLTLSFRPLTVLCGVNGSGKSSVMQLLLLLKAFAVDAKAGLVKLNNNDFLNLGRRKDVVYRWSGDCVVRIGLEMESQSCVVESVAEEDISNDDFMTFKMTDGFCREFFDKHVKYLSADRQPPQSFHKPSSYAVKMRDVGSHGDTAVALIDAFGHLEMIPSELCHEESGLDRTLKGQVNAWLREVSPGVSVRVSPMGDLLRLDIDYGSTASAQGFRPENVGFGISYVLPVLVMILTAQKGDCLLIENPGAHLHPQGQAQLGRLIAKAAAYGIQIIIETHSDHIVNGIRVGCKKRADEHREECFADDDVLYYDGAIINFFERIAEGDENLVEQYTKVTPIRIEATGELESYPLGFLDEWPHQMGELA